MRDWDQAFDRFSVEVFQWMFWLLGAIAEQVAAAWAWLPEDWHPAIKVLVLLFSAIVALRLIGMGVRGAIHSAGWPLRQLGLWRLKRKSPYGRASWAGWDELRRAGMLNPGGLFLGQWQGRARQADLFRHGEGHLLTIAGAGAGKTTGMVIPALLEGREGAFIVTDPKAQLAAMTANYRRSLGEVFFINPFAGELAAQTGVALPDSGFNPLSVLEPGYNLKDDAANLARLLMVTDRRDSGSYWNDEAAGLLALFMVWMVLREPQKNRTLAYLWQIVRESKTQLQQRFTWMAAEKSHPYLKAEGTKFLDLLQIGPQWQGVISKAQLATDRYAPQTPLGDHTAKDGLNLARLKQENITIYLMVPTGRIRVAAPWLNMLMGVFGLAIGRPGPARPVYMLMDEAPALGFLPDLRNHLRESREAGMRAWIFSQTRAALAAPDLYGDNGFDDLMGLCETRSFFSIGEPVLARQISEMLGETSAVNRTKGDVGGRDRDNVNIVGVPLLRPEEILRMKKGNQVIVRTGGSPVQSRIAPYWIRDKWAKNVDQNPYRK